MFHANTQPATLACASLHHSLVRFGRIYFIAQVIHDEMAPVASRRLFRPEHETERQIRAQRRRVLAKPAGSVTALKPAACQAVAKYPA